MDDLDLEMLMRGYRGAGRTRIMRGCWRIFLPYNVWRTATNPMWYDFPVTVQPDWSRFQMYLQEGRWII